MQLWMRSHRDGWDFFRSAFIVIYFSVLSVQQIVSIRKEAHGLQVLQYLGKNRLQVTRLMALQICLKFSIPLIPWAILMLPAVLLSDPRFEDTASGASGGCGVSDLLYPALSPVFLSGLPYKYKEYFLGTTLEIPGFAGRNTEQAAPYPCPAKLRDTVLLIDKCSDGLCHIIGDMFCSLIAGRAVVISAFCK